MYNPMIEESCFGIISVHQTKKGAQISMKSHRNEALKEWSKRNNRYEQKRFPFGRFEKWTVGEFEILP